MSLSSGVARLLDMLKNVELDPCPFCGGDAEIERFGNNRQSTIYACSECGCRLETNETFNFGNRWNERHVTNKKKDEE